MIATPLKRLFLCLLAAFLVASPTLAKSKKGAAIPHNAKEELVLKVLDRLFNQRDPTVIDLYWAPDYKQHNPAFPDGAATLKGLVDMLPPDLKFEPGFITSNADIVMVHGRYSGGGRKPVVVVDIFRVENGKLVEHWDVIQEEVTETKSGRPMFDPNEGK